MKTRNPRTAAEWAAYRAGPAYRAEWAAAVAARSGRPVADCLVEFDNAAAAEAVALAARRAELAAERAARPAPTRVRVNGVRLTCTRSRGGDTPALAGYALTGDVRWSTVLKLLRGSEMNCLGGGEYDFSGVSVEGRPFWVITGPGSVTPGCDSAVFIAPVGAPAVACDWGA